MCFLALLAYGRSKSRAGTPGETELLSAPLPRQRNEESQIVTRLRSEPPTEAIGGPDRCAGQLRQRPALSAVLHVRRPFVYADAACAPTAVPARSSVSWRISPATSAWHQ